MSRQRSLCTTRTRMMIVVFTVGISMPHPSKASVTIDATQKPSSSTSTKTPMTFISSFHQNSINNGWFYIVSSGALNSTHSLVLMSVLCVLRVYGESFSCRIITILMSKFMFVFVHQHVIALNLLFVKFLQRLSLIGFARFLQNSVNFTSF